MSSVKQYNFFTSIEPGKKLNQIDATTKTSDLQILIYLILIITDKAFFRNDLNDTKLTTTLIFRPGINFTYGASSLWKRSSGSNQSLLWFLNIQKELEAFLIQILIIN